MFIAPQFISDDECETNDSEKRYGCENLELMWRGGTQLHGMHDALRPEYKHLRCKVNLEISNNCIRNRIRRMWRRVSRRSARGPWWCSTQTRFLRPKNIVCVSQKSETNPLRMCRISQNYMKNPLSVGKRASIAYGLLATGNCCFLGIFIFAKILLLHSLYLLINDSVLVPSEPYRPLSPRCSRGSGR